MQNKQTKMYLESKITYHRNMSIIMGIYNCTLVVYNKRRNPVKIGKSSVIKTRLKVYINWVYSRVFKLSNLIDRVVCCGTI